MYRIVHLDAQFSVQVHTFPRTSIRHFANPIEHYSVQQGAQVISSSSSISTHPSYSLQEQIPNTQGNQVVEAPVMTCLSKDCDSPSKSSSLHSDEVVIKQEPFYGAKIGCSLNENENVQVNSYIKIINTRS